jgi:iron complex transport system ATP-binding protein
MPDPLYIASNLKFGYHPDNLVIDGINFHLDRGEFTGLIGPNGSGKSTILKLLVGLLKTQNGEIKFDGIPVSDIPPRELAKRVAYLPQEDEVHFPFTVGEIVMLGRWPHSGGAFFDSESDRKVSLQAMDLVGITDWSGRLITELSGGERARVVLAKAIATEPEILLLDEPVSELDFKFQNEAYKLLRNLTDKGTGVVVIAHDIGSISRWADRLILLSDGKIMADGSPAEVLNEKILETAYGTPVKIISDGVDKAIFARSGRGDAV